MTKGGKRPFLRLLPADSVGTPDHPSAPVNAKPVMEHGEADARNLSIRCRTRQVAGMVFGRVPKADIASQGAIAHSDRAEGRRDDTSTDPSREPC